MEKPSAQEPLLSNFLEKKKPFSFVSTSVKWVLKIAIWGLFLFWAGFLFLFPTELAQSGFERWVGVSQGTVFGLKGSIFLLFSGPILMMAFLAVVYLILFGGEEHQQNNGRKNPSFRLWTFPVIVNGPFGVVSAAEFIGIIIFFAFVILAITVYTIHNLSHLPEIPLPPELRSTIMLKLSGLRLGLIGLFCLAFLFLPIARGSTLLRLIDIPFEHATRYHVWLGHLTMLMFTLHGLFYIVAWIIEGRFIHEILDWRDIGVANLAGVISLIAGLFMWVTSLPPVRKQNFELFFYTHQLYIVFVVFLALHVGDFIFSMAAGGIFLFMLDRFLRFWQSRKTVDVISATCLPCGTVELVLSKPPRLRYNALSFIFLQVRELSWLQWHPFSVSSSPLDGKYHLEILIKVLGTWTEKLRERINLEMLVQSTCQPHSKITASVEGPYGHESPYHLTYETLILVAGGIGISPFLAILRDIFHHIEEGKPCLPRKILVVWAVKTSDELCLLSTNDMESICPFYTDKVNLDIQIFVTREEEPPLEEGKNLRNTKSSALPIASSGCAMSALVGTGDNIWSGIFVSTSIVGLVILMALLDIYYINPFKISAWWYKGLLLLICMVASVIIFGGFVVSLWNLWEGKFPVPKSDQNLKQIEGVPTDELLASTHSWQENFESSRTIKYGRRPDFREIFESVSKSWGHVNIGVIVCGPPTLQCSVAKECRSQNLGRSSNHPIFHFNCHSFDL